MGIGYEDLHHLQKGQPPENEALLEEMTLGREVWLDRFMRHYLDLFISGGGSKVKVLVGGEGTGKTHLLRCIESRSRRSGYASAYFSAREMVGKLNDIVGLYKAIVSRIDIEAVVRGLSLEVADTLGYGTDRYSGEDKLIPQIIEDGFNRSNAEREIKNAIIRTFRQCDLSPSFTAFVYNVTHDRLVNGSEEGSKAALRWLRGEKLERYEKQATGLFETLQKPNARYWLNCLIKLLKLTGSKGLVVLIDDIEILTERAPDTGRFIYSQSAVKDTYELFRQIIDDAELLGGFLLVLSGRRSLLEDEKRGFKSYEALWMRLQSGLVPSDRFNALSDMVDVDAHFASLGEAFPGRLSEHLQKVFSQYGLKRRYREDLPNLEKYGPLRAAVIENALMVEMV